MSTASTPTTSKRKPPFSAGDIVELTIDTVIPKGKGLGRYDGFVIFVARAFPGDVCKVRITKVQRRHAEGVVEEVLTPAADRVEAPCPFHGECGGCAWQSFDYAAQVATKQAHVIEHLERISGLEKPPVRDLIPAKEQLGYRNKMEYTFTTTPDGEIAAGFYRLGDWQHVIKVDPCLLASEAGKKAHKTVVNWANRYEMPVAEKNDLNAVKGALRTLVIRTATNTDEVMVHLVTSPGKVPHLMELVDDLSAEVPGIASIVHSENAAGNDSLMNVEPSILWGNEYFVETVAGNDLRVRPLSFLQPNTKMAEILYEEVLAAAQLTGTEVVYDIYSGIGSISCALARQAGEVHGIEIVEEAVFSAKENAVANGLMNITFHHGNARPILKFIEGTGVPSPDVIVVDPPRSGLVPKVVRRIAEKTPDRLVYVSCNPATFARDVESFADHGYELSYVQPVDQFPHTPHVELVALLLPIPGWEPPAEESQADER